ASRGVSVEVLATDINSEALERARAAVYGEWSTRTLPAELRRFLEPAPGGGHRVVDDVRARVRFLRHNLLGAAPAPATSGAWDLVLCRNVLIYFRRAEAAGTLERLARSLSDDGWLFVGGGEVLQAAPAGFAL